MDMNHFIGRRFSLISKSDIRYVGTLHEINPEASTIALETVMSHGTEGRRGNPAEEIAPSSSVYEYIVFRGSDVKDISFADEQKDNNKPEPPQVPDDPAILGTQSRPGPPQQPPSRGQPSQPQQPQQAQQPQQGQQPQQPQPQQQQGPPGYPQQPPFPGYYNPYGQRFGPPNFPPGPGFGPNMPYNAPQGWMPPGQGFPQGPGQFPPPPQMPIGPPQQPQGQQQPQQPHPPAGQQPQHRQQQGAGRGQPPASNFPKPTSELPVGEKVASKPGSKPATPSPAAPQGQKPEPAVAQPTGPTAANTNKSGAPSDKKDDRVAIPLPTAGTKPPVPTVSNGAVGDGSPAGAQNARSTATAMQEASRAATAAVAAAMAKLPQTSAQQTQVQPQPTEGGAVESVTKKMGDMKPFDGQRGRGTHPGGRGGRGGHRGGHHQQQQHGRKFEVPTTDYDFESANAKFNKQDLVKEAIASGSPLTEPGESAVNGAVGGEEAKSSPNGTAPGANHHTAYDKSSSFFDNISSETRDREEGRQGVKEWRSEEAKKNMETFGQGSVDGGHRGGYRGRGRGRGYGRGRGGNSRGYSSGRGRGSGRGGRGMSQATGVPST